MPARSSGNERVFEVTADLAALLVLAAFVAGLVDAIAGGGGLITVPALLLAGASPLQALATNKLQGTFGAATAVVTYARAGQVRPGEQVGMAVVSGLAGAGGALVAHAVPVEVLRVVMPVVLVGIALFFALEAGVERCGAGAVDQSGGVHLYGGAADRGL